MKDLYSYLLKGNSASFYSGLDGYTKPMLLRIETKPKVVKQIINAEQVAKFHKKTDTFVNKEISKRVENKTAIKNLIRPVDTKFKIELSDSKTLKETRLLPGDFEIDTMFAVFNDFVTLTNLDEDENFGVIVQDKKIAELSHSFFDNLWKQAEKV